MRSMLRIGGLAIVLAATAVQAQTDLPPAAIARDDGSVTFQVGMTFDEIEREMLLKTLAHHGNNKRQAARTLGITTKTIYNRLLRYRSLGLIGDEQLGTEEDD